MGIWAGRKGPRPVSYCQVCDTSDLTFSDDVRGSRIFNDRSTLSSCVGRLGRRCAGDRWCLFWTGGTAKGALTSIVGGAVFVLCMYLTGNNLFGLNAGVLGLPVSALLFAGVSLVTRPNAASVTEGFIDGIPDSGEILSNISKLSNR